MTRRSNDPIYSDKVDSNDQGIVLSENLPKNPKAIYEEGRRLAESQKGLNVDGRVEYDSRHAFCPEICNESSIRYSYTAEAGIMFLKSNPEYTLLLGATIRGHAYIYPSATVSAYIVYPFATIGGRNYFIGKGPYGFEVTGAISILAVIAHETGLLAGKFHGEDMIQREYDSIMEVGK